MMWDGNSSRQIGDVFNHDLSSAPFASERGEKDVYVARFDDTGLAIAS